MKQHALEPLRTALTLWLPLAVLFAIAGFNTTSLEAGTLPRLAALVELVRRTFPADTGDPFVQVLALFALLSLAIIWFVHLQEVFARLRQTLDRGILGKSLVSFALGAGVHRGGSFVFLGKGNQQLSAAPFLRGRSVAFRRILGPVLAHFLQLGGPLYGLFHYAVHYLTICMSLAFLATHETVLSHFELVSLSSTEFLNFHFRLLGYSELLVYLAILIVFTVGVHGKALWALFGLMLLSHEAVPMVGFVPVLFAQRRTKEAIGCVGVALGYATITFALSGQSLGELYRMHAQINQRSVIDLLAGNPWSAVWGAGVVYKALWLIIIQVILRELRRANWDRALSVLLCVALPLTLILLGNDTSRLFSFGFMGLLFALAHRVKHLTARSRFILFLVHLVLPSFYIGTTASEIWLDGMYRPYGWLFRQPLTVGSISVMPNQ